MKKTAKKTAKKAVKKTAKKTAKKAVKKTSAKRATAAQPTAGLDDLDEELTGAVDPDAVDTLDTVDTDDVDTDVDDFDPLIGEDDEDDEVDEVDDVDGVEGAEDEDDEDSEEEASSVWDIEESAALRQARKDAQLTASADSVRAYLKQIGKVALLDAEMEVSLAKRIEAGLYAQHRLDEMELSLIHI